MRDAEIGMTAKWMAKLCEPYILWSFGGRMEFAQSPAAAVEEAVEFGYERLTYRVFEVVELA